MNAHSQELTSTKPKIIIIDDAGPTENDATDRLQDWEARVAVEGDTDLNHDNVEGAR